MNANGTAQTSRQPSPMRVCDISFYKTDKKNPVEKVKPYPGVYQAGPCGEDGESFLQEILNGLKNIYPKVSYIKL